MDARVSGTQTVVRTGALSTVLLAMLAGCGIKADFSPTIEYPQSSRSPEEIELYMEGEAPINDVELVGKVTTDGGKDTQEANRADVLAAMKKKAAEAGLDGIRDVKCVPVGQPGQGLCSGQGFVYKE